ncbi:MAG: hypothetical protein ABI980_11430 [Nitrospirota bacterium]
MGSHQENGRTEHATAYWRIIRAVGYVLAVSAQSSPYLDPLEPPFIKGIPLYERIDQELGPLGYQDYTAWLPLIPCR